jgi:hypothetical protein
MLTHHLHDSKTGARIAILAYETALIPGDTVEYAGAFYNVRARHFNSLRTDEIKVIVERKL